MSDQSSRRKLTEQAKSDIAAILGLGGSMKLAAFYSNCHPETIRREARRDSAFADKIRHCEVSPEITLLKAIQQAASDSRQWRAAAWALERIYPNRYAKRSAGVLSSEQVEELVEQLTAIINKEVPVSQYRRRLIRRIAELLTQLPDGKRGHRE